MALAFEKLWFDKRSHDSAERQYFEKIAQVVFQKIAGDSTFKSDHYNISDKCSDLINSNTLKSKTEKYKDNKSLILEHESNGRTKNSKCQPKNAKINKEAADICNMQNKENIKTIEKFNGTKDDVKEKEINFLNEKSKKYNAKEAKEKRNKEDTKNKSRKNRGNDIGGNKETAMPFARNKERLSDQGPEPLICPILPAGGSLANEVAKARRHIKESLQCMDDIVALADVSSSDIAPRVAILEKDNQHLQNVVQNLRGILDKLEERMKNLEDRAPYIAICPPKPDYVDHPKQISKTVEDDLNLFGSDSEGEDAEAAKIREERLAAYAAKKSKKPVLIAKSNIILDVKPWDDETDMKDMEIAVRKIETDGLLWGASKLVPLAFGIHKLQISCVVEDDKVSVDWLTEQIQDIEYYVQSVDIAAFNKV